MKHIFLVNNKSGYNNSKLDSNIYQVCKNLNLDFRIIVADNIEVMKIQASFYKYEDAIIYAVGGDGTLQVILNEIIGGKAKLGIVPYGTGNDFYRSLNEYRSENLDVNVMNVNGMYGLNIFSLGIDADICANVEKLKRLPLPTKYLYHLSALYTFFKYKNQVIGVNDFFEKKTLIAICNGSYYGRGHIIAPKADILTHEAFIVSAENMSKLEMIKFWFEVMRGEHEDNQAIDLFTSDKEIFIETMNTLSGQLDGELIEGNKFKIVPHASTISVVNNRRLIRELTVDKK